MLQFLKNLIFNPRSGYEISLKECQEMAAPLLQYFTQDPSSHSDWYGYCASARPVMSLAVDSALALGCLFLFSKAAAYMFSTTQSRTIEGVQNDELLEILRQANYETNKIDFLLRSKGIDNPLCVYISPQSLASQAPLFKLLLYRLGRSGIIMMTPHFIMPTDALKSPHFGLIQGNTLLLYNTYFIEEALDLPALRKSFDVKDREKYPHAFYDSGINEDAQRLLEKLVEGKIFNIQVLIEQPEYQRLTAVEYTPDGQDTRMRYYM